MLYDLNMHWSPSMTQDQLLDILRLSGSLGYDTVAINHILTLPLPSQYKKPLPDLTTLAASTSAKLPNILHRVTVSLAEPAAANFRIPSLVPMYDILSVRPTTKDSFNNACLNLDVPIISLDMTQNFPFHFRPKPCMAAVTRGVRFEICYGQVLAPNVEARERAAFIGNVSSLIRATGGRGIILSSGAKAAMALRAPADVVNLMSVWGLSNEKGLEALRSIPRGVVVNEGIKRSGFRGVIDIVEIPKPKEASKGAAQNHDKIGDGQQTKTGEDKNATKRKSGKDEAGGVSNRQAKKMKLAARDKTNKS